MNVPLWAAELADAFWKSAGMREEFPRALRRPIARALQMVIVSLPRLRLRDVLDWLEQQGFGCPCDAPDRRLHGFLLARHGWGYVFLDGDDAEDEQRMSLAHELAHFLRHYWQPRREVRLKLGSQAIEVLDGRRPPTDTERVHALLAGVSVGVHWHLLGREEEDGFAAGTARTAEDEADRLAYELLAPAHEVMFHAGKATSLELATLIRSDFGLPAGHARRYSEVLRPSPVSDPLLRRLGLT